MKYILVALEGELPNHNLDSNEYKVWYHGVGKVNATMYATLACLQKDCELVINFGTAGVLTKGLEGKLHRVGTVVQRDMDARPQAPLGDTPFEKTGLQGPLKLNDSPITISSGDNFVQSPPELGSDLVDMEGYGVVKVCKHLSKPVELVKYGTDFADENSAEEWEANMSKGKDLFLDWLKKEYV